MHVLPLHIAENGKSERMLRTLNNVVHTLLFRGLMPASYWVDGLHTTTHLINRLPTKTLRLASPHFTHHCTHPSYCKLRVVFGFACYPNLSRYTI